VKGRDLISGAPKTIEVNSEEIRDALAEPVTAVVEAIKTALERTPPELAADIVDNGIILAGGGSLLANLDILIKEKTGLPVALAEDPLTCVVRGSGKALQDMDLLRKVTTV
jgi:rod shape-determining protein MreB